MLSLFLLLNKFLEELLVFEDFGSAASADVDLPYRGELVLRMLLLGI